MTRLIQWVSAAPHIRVPILVAVIGIGGVVLGSLLNSVIWPFVKYAFSKIGEGCAALTQQRKFERHYLDWVVAQHRFLPLLPTTLVPVTEKRTHPVEKLYVPLDVIDEGQEKEKITVATALVKYGSIVVLGEPGAGKTTMLRFLALLFAQARRKRPIIAVSPNRRKNARAVHQARQIIKESYGYEKAPLPIFVYLNKLGENFGPESGESFLDAVREQWKTVDKLRGLPEEFFNKKIAHGECIFLLDAFDEVGSRTGRDRIAHHIGQMASTVPQGNRFITTSRIIGYDGQLGKFGFSVLTVQRLSWELIEALVRKWHESIDAQELTESLLTTLRNNPRIADLAVNPMLLSLIVLVQYVRRLIPDKRHILYHECVNILVERRYAPPALQETYNQFLPSDEAITFLKHVASILHRTRSREVTRKELEERFVPQIQKTMPHTVAATRSASALVKNIEERSQLLVERGLNEKGNPLVAFSHLTFQEYLTSLSLNGEIAERGEKAVSSEVLTLFERDPEWWEEVALLYAAQLENTQRHAFFERLFRPE